jgi:hypothetical protein
MHVGEGAGLGGEGRGRASKLGVAAASLQYHASLNSRPWTRHCNYHCVSLLLLLYVAVTHAPGLKVRRQAPAASAGCPGRPT